MAKSIMIQGTMSNAGKSIIAGGLCRIFRQDGYRVAPFKSQNMALNSYITKEGLEMGRAQVMQAEAAGIEPEVAMNPILLKPTNDTGSQVIVNGEVVETMTAVEYYARKKQFIPEIMKAYHSLEERYDIIVLEGAGSPAEINLKENDIVNMGMAQLANAPVLLVGDIDRGGVFAQLLGTVALLTKEEQRYLKAFIINKFRGDKRILQPGLSMLYEKCPYPVAGVVPYMHLDIDDEDSLTERFHKRDTSGSVDIAVIRFPRIANFTDFNAFECYEQVSVRYVSEPAQLGDPDMILLPGTKNTIGDLLWMRQNGLEAKLKQQASRGKIIFGICGGYQMLGERIRDPEGVECQGELAGMGLLPVITQFAPQKTRTQVMGKFASVKGILAALSGCPLEGYEIHMGRSVVTGDGLTSIQEITTGADTQTEKADGAQKENIYGSYVHGIFDNAAVSKTIVMALLQEKGLDAGQTAAFDMQAYKEKQYDILADTLRANLDMEQIYQIVEEGGDGNGRDNIGTGAAGTD